MCRLTTRRFFSFDLLFGVAAPTLASMSAVSMSTLLLLILSSMLTLATQV
jgi:hypothetical protein